MKMPFLLEFAFYLLRMRFESLRLLVYRACDVVVHRELGPGVYMVGSRNCSWKCPQLAVASSHRVESRNHGQAASTSPSISSTHKELRGQDKYSYSITHHPAAHPPQNLLIVLRLCPKQPTHASYPLLHRLRPTSLPLHTC